MAQTRKYYLKKHYLTLRSKEKFPWRSFLNSIFLSGPYHNIFVFRDRSMIFGMWVHNHKAVCRVPRKYYLKKHYLTLRSKEKFPWRSLQYATHRLMVMHPHTINLSQKTKMLWPGQEKTISIFLSGP
jgi:hypothetical protein